MREKEQAAKKATEGKNRSQISVRSDKRESVHRVEGLVLFLVTAEGKRGCVMVKGGSLLRLSTY